MPVRLLPDAWARDGCRAPLRRVLSVVVLPARYGRLGRRPFTGRGVPRLHESARRKLPAPAPAPAPAPLPLPPACSSRLRTLRGTAGVYSAVLRRRTNGSRSYLRARGQCPRWRVTTCRRQHTSVRHHVRCEGSQSATEAMPCEVQPSTWTSPDDGSSHLGSELGPQCCIGTPEALHNRHTHASRRWAQTARHNHNHHPPTRTLCTMGSRLRMPGICATTSRARREPPAKSA